MYNATIKHKIDTDWTRGIGAAKSGISRPGI
jgi:hypothetical protein